MWTKQDTEHSVSPLRKNLTGITNECIKSIND